MQPLTPHRCDQLYLNAMMIKHATCLHDLGTAFNLPGTQVRKLMMTTAAQRADSGGGGGGAPSLRGSPMADACMIHLTVLPSKHHTSHYLLKRALEHTDVLQCSSHEPVTVDRGAMATALPGEDVLQGVTTYDITKIWCKGYADGCQLIAPGAAGDSDSRPPPAIAAPTSTAPATTAADSTPRPPVDDSPIRPPLGSVDEDELPGAAQEVMRRTAARSWDKRTVILLFATNDFMDLAINWAQAATAIGITNFVLVCMDKALAHNFDGFEAPPALLYP